ncbi:MAG: DUF3501 family protein [Candidatus Binatia bacterium]
MRKVALDEIVGLERYEHDRPEFRRRIIGMKKARRVPVGDRVTFVFENHDTMLFQIQEMLRAEHIVDLDRIREEMAVYNALVPDAGELSATMLIEITAGERIREELVRLIGIDEAVRLEIGDPSRGGFTVRGEFEAGRTKEDKLSAVQYVRFRLAQPARQAFLSGTQPVRVVIDHPNYRHAAVVSGASRESLARDLEAV